MRGMPLDPKDHRAAIGPRLRAARQAQQLTIDEVAKISNLTKGFLSRVERDLTSPSVATLQVLCDVLSISVGSLFEEPDVLLVRGGTGPRLNLGGVNSEEHLISPRTEGRLQVIRSLIGPQGHGGEQLYSIAADIDVLHVLSGSLRVSFTGRNWDVHAGDTLTFNGREPHSWSVLSEDGAEVIWVLSPALWTA